MPPISEALSAEIIALLPRLRRFARALAGNVSDADDLVQIGLERALARSEQLRAGAPLAGWLFGIVRNAWIDETRSRARRRRVFAPEELGEHIADPNSAHAQILPVQQAMERLPDEQREVFVGHEIEGRSFKEMAAESGVSINTAGSQAVCGAASA